jgi:hypothetical protein
MKETHPIILVTLNPTNCIIVFQLANVILQWPLKHTFEVHFNSWTTTIIKQYIEDSQNPQIEFNMNDLKPCICEWLHCAWK